jgi:alkylation response protein AidB-like acyl-CoA dehydrogenase
MDFGLSDEQGLLEQTIRRYLESEAPVSRVREIMETENGHDPGLWKGLAELGLAGILVAEEHGGGGLALLDAAVAAESLGWAVAPVPFLGTAVMAPVALSTAGSPAQRAEWLPRIAMGDCCVGVAASELVAAREDAGLRLEDGRLHGKAIFAVDAGAADLFLVPVGGDSLALVSRDAPGLSLELLKTIDRTRRLGELVFDGVAPEEWIGGEGGAAEGLGRMLDAGRIALAADLLGASEWCLERAVDYAQQRKQFGRLIGSFQAVKHMCAEMAAELEPARSLVWYAAHAFSELPGEASLMAAHAKAHMAEIGTQIARTSTEVHGGIGFTDEHDLHLWFKRVGVDRQLLGGPATLREHAAGLQGWAPA